MANQSANILGNTDLNTLNSKVNTLSSYVSSFNSAVKKTDSLLETNGAGKTFLKSDSQYPTGAQAAKNIKKITTELLSSKITLDRVVSQLRLYISTQQKANQAKK